jgi:rRNA small subunit pseudouridine methyltransferase Nep1
MAQCLTKLKVRAESGSQTLLSVIKNPITDHLPIGCKIIGTSSLADLKTMKDYVQQLSPAGSSSWSKPIAYVIGAVSIGNPGMDNDYV